MLEVKVPRKFNFKKGLLTLLNKYFTAPKEKKVREVTAALPQIVRRTLSGRESWTQRRGSAPVAASDLCGLAALAAVRGANGGRRKPSPIVSCQQWLSKTTYSVQERTFQHIPRRSSLPVEVLTGANRSAFSLIFCACFYFICMLLLWYLWCLFVCGSLCKVFISKHNE